MQVADRGRENRFDYEAVRRVTTFEKASGRRQRQGMELETGLVQQTGRPGLRLRPDSV